MLWVWDVRIIFAVNLKLYIMNYYYEIHVTGKNGFSTSVITDIEMDDDDIIQTAYENDILHGDDCHHVDYIQELTFEEWDEQFNFNKFICGSCGEGCKEYTYNESTDVDECNKCKN